MRYWRIGLAGAVAVAAVTVGFVVTRPAGAQPTVTVYKTPN